MKDGQLFLVNRKRVKLYLEGTINTFKEVQYFDCNIYKYEMDDQMVEEDDDTKGLCQDITEV